MQTDAVKSAPKMHLMFYTAISDLRLDLLVIHAVNPADQIGRLGTVKRGERACRNKSVSENVFCFSKVCIPYNHEKRQQQKGFV